jgi:hypothetical protein
MDVRAVDPADDAVISFVEDRKQAAGGIRTDAEALDSLGAVARSSGSYRARRAPKPPAARLGRRRDA